MAEEDDCIIIDDNVNYKSISCENVPILFLDKNVAKQHFSQFGKINRFIHHPKRLSCTVEYENEEDAKNAYLNARNYNGSNFNIKYTTNEIIHSRNTEEWIQSDVQNELDSIAKSKQYHSNTKYLPKSNKSIKKQANDVFLRLEPNPKTQFESVIKRQAFNAEDRYNILDARDKLIRLKTLRTTDIKKVVSIKGTCPDMCPEKERYSREAKHQVSIFELDENNYNSMNHKIAIKEYTRSSADQEIPLEHELRPEPILQMTMIYLTHKVLDLCELPEVNIGDWFHFIWDRMRSIRKDITQQDLCTLGTTELVEQCARFHIHCAARLIAEDSAVFDQRINTENLTKCLQTLKYMYNDLRLKNIESPKEAEFRSYIVLLNLNDSNFLWELKQLPEKIQNSEQLRFAISVYLAMENNNYVKFFKLVKSTTYLNACVLLRYFTQVRLHAIRSIVSAYTWPKGPIPLPLTYLKNILGFESEESLSTFAENCGLECDGYNILLRRFSFNTPETHINMERSLNFVENKRNISVGEVVRAKKLDALTVFENYEPQNSFDENGFLKSEIWFDNNQITVSVADDKSDIFKVPLPSSPISPKSIAKNNLTSVKPILNTTIFENKPFHFQAEASQNIFTDSKSNIFENQSNKIFESPFKIVATQNNQSVISDGIFEKGIFQRNSPENENIFDFMFSERSTKDMIPKNSFIIPSKDEIDKNMEKQIQEIKAKEIEEMKAKEIQEMKARQEQKLKELEEIKRKQLVEEENHKQKIREIEEVAKGETNEILEMTALNEIYKIAEDELKIFKEINQAIEQNASDVLTEYIHMTLVEITQEEINLFNMNKALLHKYFQIWIECTKKKIESRKLIESVPVWMNSQTLQESAENISHPLQKESLSLMRRYRSGIPYILNLPEIAPKPIDWFDLFENSFNFRKNQNNIGLLKLKNYYKLVISLPQEDEEIYGFTSYMSGLLRALTIKSSDKNIYFRQCKNNLAICIRKFEGIHPLNELEKPVTTEINNSNGLLFFMTCTNPRNSKKRLYNLFKLTKIYDTIPIIIIVYNSKLSEIEIENHLDLKYLQLNENIPDYKIISCTERRESKTLIRTLQKSLRFLNNYYDFEIQLEMQNLCTFLKITLGQEFWQKLFETWNINAPFREACNNPEFIINLYNECISKLIESIDEDYEYLPEFPKELKIFTPNLNYDVPLGLEYFPDDWKNVDRLNKLKKFFKLLKIIKPKFNNENLGKLQDSINEYTNLLISDEKYAQNCSYSAIKVLLEKLSNNNTIEVNLEQSFEYIPWLNIISVICLKLLEYVYKNHNDSIPKEIIYKKNSYKELTTRPWWNESNSLKQINFKDKRKSNEKTIIPEKKTKIENEVIDYELLFKKGEMLSEKSDKTIKKYRELSNTIRETSRAFDMMLYNEEKNIRLKQKFIENNI